MTDTIERFHRRHIAWLLASLALVAAPHAQRLPWWITLLVVMLFVWRGYVALYALKLPRKWLLLLFAALAVCTLALFTFHTVDEAGVATYITPFRITRSPLK